MRTAISEFSSNINTMDKDKILLVDFQEKNVPLSVQYASEKVIAKMLYE